MINVSLRVRHAIPEDHHQIASLILNEANTHRHLDWRSPLEWIGFPNYWVLEEDGHVMAVFACPEDPPHVAWVRLFAYHPRFSAVEAWSALWEAAHNEIIRTDSQTQIAAIVVKQWFQNILLSSGFKLKQNIALLQLTSENVRTFSTPKSVHIRPMQDQDMPIVTQVDLAAFGWFWHNTLDALQRARLQSLIATVAENDSGVIVGYQLSTGNAFGVHLARLGVQPESQAQGVGAALVSDLIRRCGSTQLDRISVNTQADNVASLSLYRKLGFALTGEHFPVFMYPTDKGI